MLVDKETDLILLEWAFASERTHQYPFRCWLCGFEVPSEEDKIWWHGLGNCIEITDEMLKQWEEDDAESQKAAEEKSEDVERR